MNNTSKTIFNDQRIVSLRGIKNSVDPGRPYAFLIEKEKAVSGRIEDVATIFLTNSECPFKCLMCDLWKNTTDTPVQIGKIPEQIKWALEQLPKSNQIKLYNSGNFFDKKAIPPEDYGEITQLLTEFKSVTIECHPRLINHRCLDFAHMLEGDLEVAIGLETVHPEILPLLNKKMELQDFESSVKFLGDNGIRTRAFILLKTPFMTEEEGVFWAKKSIDFAFKCGVECCSVIPTRAGNGALDRLMGNGLFREPTIFSLEEVMEYAIGLEKGRVFADLWDLERFSTCDQCFDRRKQRLNEMNHSQQSIPGVDCICS